MFYQHAQYERGNALNNSVGRIGPVLAFMLAERRGQGSNPVGAEVINEMELKVEKQELLKEVELLEKVGALLEEETLLMVDKALNCCFI